MIPLTLQMKRIHITKRDLFYTDVKLFVNQMDSDGVLDDVATMIGCTRSNLHVVASGGCVALILFLAVLRATFHFVISLSQAVLIGHIYFRCNR